MSCDPRALGVLFALTLGAAAAHAEPPAIPGSKPFTVTAAAVTAKRGAPATAKVVFKPAGGFHLNKDFPTSLKLQAPTGVTMARTSFNQADAQLSDNEGVFAIALTPNEPGKKVITGTLNFAVCTDNTCNPQKSPVSIEVNVQ